jgi:Domain of unknown function (DUF4276)
MRAEHLEVLVEEPSMEAFLTELLPRLLDGRATFTLHAHQGKSDLIEKLGSRLRAYEKWLPKAMRIIVLVDRDDANCIELKKKLERDAKAAGLLTRAASGGGSWQVVNRLAIEELEAWFFGEWTAVRNVYPSASASIPQQAAYREPDAIAGGTWEALERVLRSAGYFSGGLRKMEAASKIGKQFNAAVAQSPSFIAFREALLEAVA